MADDAVQMSVQDLQNAFVGALKQSGLLQRQNTTSSSSAGGDFRTTTKDFNKALGGVSGFLNQAGGSVSQVSRGMLSTIPIFKAFSGVVGDGIGFLEESNSVFQQLSKVGAGFNGDLGALRAGAADTRLPLGEFASLIGSNSELLAGLGAGVNQGAKRFAQLSRAMFEDGNVIGGMMNLGYTIGESNEVLMEQAGILSRQRRLQNMDDKAVAQATLQMAENMAVVAEITGKNAEQQRQELIDAQRDGKNIAANRSLEAQGIKDATQTFSTAFTALAPLGPQAQAFLSDMNQAQAPLSDLTKNFEAMNPQTAAILKQMDAVRRSDLSTQEKNRRLQELGIKAQGVAAKEMVNETNRFAASVGQINAIGSSQADVIASTERARQGIEAARLELARDKFGIEEGKAVSDAQLASVSLTEAAKKYNAEVKNIVGAQTGGGAEGQDLSRELNKATISLADSASSVNKEIATNLSANTKLINQISGAIAGTATVAQGLSDLGKSGIQEFGTDNVNPDDINKNFTELFAPIIQNNAMNTRIGNLDEILNAITGIKAEDIQTTLDNARSRQGRAIGGNVLEGMAYKIGELGPETFVPQMDGAIIPNMKAMLNRMPDIAGQMQTNMQSAQEQIGPAAQKMLSDLNSTGSVEQKLDVLNQTLLQLVNINTLQARTGEKQLKQGRSVGNLMGGIGRA